MTLALICLASTILGGVVGWVLGPRGFALVIPDSFRRNPYGYLTNQAGHVVLGFFLAFVTAMASVALAGEPPARFDLWIGLLCFFTAFEFMLFGETFDLFDDVIFTIVYGSGATIYGVKWLQGFDFKADLLSVAPFLAVALAHVTIGSAWREWDRRRGDA
jgi:hypothetical protein